MTDPRAQSVLSYRALRSVKQAGGRFPPTRPGLLAGDSTTSPLLRMSGLEGLAALAAAAQMLDYTFKAVFAGMAVRQRILAAPGQFQKYSQQLSGLVALVNTIRLNPSLRSPEVHRLLSQISPSLAVAQKSLESIQKRGGRVWRIRWQFKVASGAVQKTVVDHLDDLDRSITQLLLCIGSANSIQLANVDKSVTELLRRIEPSQSPVEGPDTMQQQRSISPAGQECDSGVEMDEDGSGRPLPGVKKGSFYGNVSITGSSRVTNGNITNIMSPRPGSRLIPTETRPHKYQKIEIKATTSGKPWVANGEVGPGTAEHQFQEIAVDGGMVVNGDIDSIESMKAYFTATSMDSGSK